MGLNDKCPCGSKIKYKKCCKTYHDGRVAKNALLLMRSRYCAYATKEYKYILTTTHKSTRDDNMENIKLFSNNTKFHNLNIIDFIDGETEAFVTFHVTIFTDNKDTSFSEKSRFIKEENRWYYVDGKILDNF